MLSTRRLALAILATTLMFSMSGCGSSGSKDKASSTTVASATTPNAAKASTTTQPDDGSPFCAAIKKYKANKALDTATLGTTGGPEKVAEAFAELESLAPASLKPSIRIVADALQVIATTKASTKEEMDKLNAKVSTKKIADASNAFEAYVEDNCKVSLTD